MRDNRISLREINAKKAVSIHPQILIYSGIACLILAGVLVMLLVSIW